MSAGDAIATMVGELRRLFLQPPRWTLGVAESLTCGRIQAAIGAVSGASDFFVGGLTAYTTGQKVRHLDVDEQAAQACGAVSAEITAQMALGACRLFGADFALATTGFAEPNPAANVPQPIAYWAIARTGGAKTADVISEGFLERPGLDRVAMQNVVVRETLTALVACLRNLRRS